MAKVTAADHGSSATGSDPPAALVTGSSRGIGRAVALELAEQGYGVVINYFRSPDAAEQVVAEVQQRGGRAVAARANVGDAQDREMLLEQAVERFGRLDLLVNNAGITSPGRRDLLEASQENWDTVFDTNLKGPFFLAQSAARRMIGWIGSGKIPHGAIVNISSISAYAVSTDRVDYCIAKSAMEMMTWQLAVRLAEEKIRVYEICPGIIASDMTAPVQDKYDKLIAEGLSPMRRWGQGEDVARAVAAVVSDAFAFTTGQRIHVDGGFHIRRL